MKKNKELKPRGEILVVFKKDVPLEVSGPILVANGMTILRVHKYEPIYRVGVPEGSEREKAHLLKEFAQVDSVYVCRGDKLKDDDKYTMAP